MTAVFRGHSHRSASNQTTVDGRAPHFRRSASIPQDVILPFAGGRVAERRRRGWSGPRPSDSTRTDITTPSRRRPRPLMPSIPRQPRLQASNGKMLTRRALAQPERDLTAAQREADILNRFDFMAFAEQLSRICRPHCRSTVWERRLHPRFRAAPTARDRGETHNRRSSTDRHLGHKAVI